MDNGRPTVHLHVLVPLTLAAHAYIKITDSTTRLNPTKMHPGGVHQHNFGGFSTAGADEHRDAARMSVQLCM